jgi:hypothetical protein
MEGFMASEVRALDGALSVPLAGLRGDSADVAVRQSYSPLRKRVLR